MAASTRFGQAQASFRPTAASIPPQGAKLVLQVPRGLPHNLHPLNPLEFLLRGATIYPDHLAVAHPDVAHPVFYTYAVFAQRVQNLAYALLDAGIQPGDRVAVIAPNCPMIAEALQAAIAARAIVVTINTRLTPPEVAYILEHSAPRVVLVDHEYVHLLPKPSPFPTTSTTSSAPSSQSQFDFKVVIGQDTGRQGCQYEDFLSEGRRKSGEKGWAGLEMHADENAPFCLNYTSGTTGRPKGVLTTLRGTYLGAIANAYEARMTSESTYLWVLPMFHAAGWTFPWACTFAFSTQLTIRSVNYPQIWKHFLQSGVTHYCGAPTVQIGIVNDPLARPLPHEIKAIIAGAAPTANLLGALEQKGIAPVHVYGLTETYGPFVRNFAHPSWKDLPLAERASLTARQGHAFATSTPARVVYPLSDEEEGEVELVDVPKDGHTVGEVVMRGNIAMAGYYRDPSATAKAFRGGYFHSGDLAVWYPDGAIAIQDRSKDLIISGGENASSLAIETALAAHPDVLEVAVVGRAHEKWGERAMAFVLLRNEAVEKWKGRHREFEKELIAHARGRLPGFATPEWVVVVDELPKTSTGKILKTVLRKRAAEEAERETTSSKAKAKL